MGDKFICIVSLLFNLPFCIQLLIHFSPSSSASEQKRQFNIKIKGVERLFLCLENGFTIKFVHTLRKSNELPFGSSKKPRMIFSCLALAACSLIGGSEFENDLNRFVWFYCLSGKLIVAIFFVWCLSAEMNKSNKFMNERIKKVQQSHKLCFRNANLSGENISFSNKMPLFKICHGKLLNFSSAESFQLPYSP